MRNSVTQSILGLFLCFYMENGTRKSLVTVTGCNSQSAAVAVTVTVDMAEFQRDLKLMQNFVLFCLLNVRIFFSKQILKPVSI